MLARSPLALILLLLAACATPSTDPRQLPAGRWSLDTAHASVIWRVQHLGLSWYTGRFDALAASLEFDPAQPEASQLTVIIQAASLSSGHEEFDRILVTDWLHADRHPEISFVTEQIEVIDATHGRASGQLTLNGQTGPAQMMIEFYGGRFNMLEGRDVIGFGGDMVIDRTEFGVGFLPQSIAGTDIRIHIEAEFLRQGAIHD